MNDDRYGTDPAALEDARGYAQRGGRGQEGPDVKVIHKSDIDRCPRRSFLASHYRPDGTCRCDEEAT